MKRGLRAQARMLDEINTEGDAAVRIVLDTFDAGKTVDDAADALQRWILSHPREVVRIATAAILFAAAERPC